MPSGRAIAGVVLQMTEWAIRNEVEPGLIASRSPGLPCLSGYGKSYGTRYSLSAGSGHGGSADATGLCDRLG